MVLSTDLSSVAMVTAVVASSSVAGIGFAVDGPAMQTLLPQFVRSDELRSAMLLNTLPTTLGRLLGPVGGAYAATHFVPSAAFGVAAALHGVLLVLLVGVCAPKPDRPITGVRTSVRAAFAYVRTEPVLILALVGTAAVGAGTEPTLTLSPSLADLFGSNEALVGYVNIAFGVGAMAGVAASAVVGRRISVRVTASVGLSSIGLGSLVVAAAPSSMWALVGLTLSGVGFSSGMAGFSALLQQHTVPEYRGRVMALWMVAFVGSRPFAAFAVGLASDAVGVRATFGAVGSTVLATVWLCRPARLRHRSAHAEA